MEKGRVVIISMLATDPPARINAARMAADDPRISASFRAVSNLIGGEYPAVHDVIRHLIVDYPQGRAEAWTARARVNPSSQLGKNLGSPGLFLTIIAGPGTGGGTSSGPEPPSLDEPGRFPLEVGSSFSGSSGFISLSGRASESVKALSALYQGGEADIPVGGGFWFLLADPDRGSPRAIIARDGEGRELGRIAGARFQQVFTGRPSGHDRVGDPLAAFAVPLAGGGQPVVPSVARWMPGDPVLSVEAAKRLITAAGLVPEIRSTDASGLNGPDVVFAQEPDEGSSMPAGGTVLLDVTAPALQAPASLLVGVSGARPISSADQSVSGLRIGIVDFSARPTPGWILDRLQDRKPKGSVFSGGRYVSSPDAPTQSVVLWKPGKEGEAATIARRLGIAKGATTEGLSPEFLATPEDSSADPAKPTYDVLVVIGTSPLKKPPDARP
jgi:PASTA domain